jgi:hypothetical protein
MAKRYSITLHPAFSYCTAPLHSPQQNRRFTKKFSSLRYAVLFVNLLVDSKDKHPMWRAAQVMETDTTTWEVLTVLYVPVNDPVLEIYKPK